MQLSPFFYKLIAPINRYGGKLAHRADVLVYLTQRTKEGYVWLSTETLAQDTGLTMASVSAILKDLIAMGALEVVKQSSLSDTLKSYIEKHYPLPPAKKIWRLTGHVELEGTEYVYALDGDMGGDMRKPVNVMNERLDDTPKPDTAQPAQLDPKPKPDDDPKSKRKTPISAWFGMTLPQAKEQGLFPQTNPQAAQRFANCTDTTKPYWELIARMIAHNDVGAHKWQDYVSTLRNGALAAFNKRVKQACLAYEAYSDADDPITIDELAWMIVHWMNTEFPEKTVSERKFPISQDALANNLPKLRFAYKQAINSVKAK